MFDGGSSSFFLYRKTQCGRKPRQTQDAQGIFLKPPDGIAYGTKDFILQVTLAAEGVTQATSGTVSHGIDGEVPTGKVFGNMIGKRHLLRTAMVGIGTILAESGDLHLYAVQNDSHGAVLQACFDDAGIGKQRLYLLRQGGGGQIPIGGYVPKQAVTQATTH